jgi:hypothetical protein
MKGIKVLRLFVMGMMAFSLLEANSWEDVLKSVSGQNLQLNDNGVVTSGEVYKANFQYQVVDGNNNGKLDDNERVYVTISDGNEGSIATGTAMTKDELTTWATENKDKFLEYIFGDNPTSGATGTQNSVTETSTAILQSVTNRTKRMRKATAKDVTEDGGMFNSQVMLNSEYASITYKGQDATSTNFMFDYFDDSETYAGEFGGMFIYKHVEADNLNTKVDTLNIAPYYRHYQDVSDDFYIAYVVNLAISLNYMKSDLFTDGAGYVEYGMGFSVVPDYAINDQWSVNGIVGFQALDKYIPTSQLDDEVKFIAEAVNDVPWQKSFNVGIGTQYEISNNMMFNANVLNVSMIGSDDGDRDESLYLAASFYYFDEAWSYSLGYKTVQNVDNYDEDAYMLTIIYNW